MYARVGIPREILHDQGGSFMNQVMSDLCSEFDISRIRPSPYHRQANGLVEEFNLSKCLFIFIQVFVFIVQPIASLDNKNKHLDGYKKTLG